MNKTIKTTLSYLALLAAGLGIGYAAPRLPGWFKPDYVEGNYSAYYPTPQTKVVMYSTKWCQFCAKSREYFAANKIAYLEHDIEATPAAAKQYMDLGSGGIPVVLIGDRKIQGFLPKAFDAALKNAGAK